MITRLFPVLTLWLCTLLVTRSATSDPEAAVGSALSPRSRKSSGALASDRGDVPGWVLITMMTAALVVGLWALAGEAFTSMFQDSMNKVKNAG